MFPANMLVRLKYAENNQLCPAESYLIIHVDISPWIISNLFVIIRLKGNVETYCYLR